MRPVMRLPAALLCALLAGAAAVAGGRVYVGKKAEEFRQIEASLPESAMENTVRLLEEKNYESIYETTSKYYPRYDAAEAYTAKLADIFAKTEGSELTYRLRSADETVRVYRIYAGETAAADVELHQDGGVWVPALSLSGQKDYRLAVPHGASVTAGGRTLESTQKKESGIPYPMFEEQHVRYDGLKTDIYELKGLLGEPAVEIAGNSRTAVLQDVLTGDLVAGEEVTDPEILEMIIDYATRIAAYPAQDTALGNVAAIADTSSYWYSRYITLQNYWFTSHAVSEFRNQEVLKCIKLSDDVMEAQVVFDYFADNGEVHRTWYIGYQLTLEKINGAWKVAGTAICNELNPRSVDPESPAE